MDGTVRDGAPTVKKKEHKKPPDRLRGIPRGLFCRADDVRAELGISFETWQMWRDAGLLTLDGLAGAEFLLTDRLHEWADAKPKIGPRPSHARKAAKKGGKRKA